jgi:spore germination protein KB
MKKTKITNRQMCFLTFGVSLGGSVLVVAALMTSIAKQDAWLGAVATVVLGLPVIWALVFLGRRFPDKNYIECLQTVWGRPVGTVVSGLSLYLWITLSYHIPWYVGDFMTSQSMPETPAYVINLVFIAAVAIAVKYGLQAFSRAFEIFILISASLFLLATVLILPNAKIENLQPFLENGLSPVFKSAFFLFAFIGCPVYTMMMIYPTEAENPKSAGKSILTGYLFSGVISFLAIILSILVLGWQITANTRYPAYRLAKEIELGVVFTRIEFIIFFSWILTQFIIDTLLFYAAVKGIAQLFRLRDHKKLVLPFALVVFVLSGVVFPDVFYQENWITFVWAPYAFIHGAVIPLLTLILYFVRGGKKKFSNSHPS